MHLLSRNRRYAASRLNACRSPGRLAKHVADGEPSRSGCPFDSRTVRACRSRTLRAEYRHALRAGPYRRAGWVQRRQLHQRFSGRRSTERLVVAANRRGVQREQHGSRGPVPHRSASHSSPSSCAEHNAQNGKMWLVNPATGVSVSREVVRGGMPPRCAAHRFASASEVRRPRRLRDQRGLVKRAVTILPSWRTRGATRGVNALAQNSVEGRNN